METVEDGGARTPIRILIADDRLRSMRERAARVGGRLEVESSLNQGTRITASIPRSTEAGA